jgi:hypothetical protein
MAKKPASTQGANHRNNRAPVLSRAGSLQLSRRFHDGDPSSMTVDEKFKELERKSLHLSLPPTVVHVGLHPGGLRRKPVFRDEEDPLLASDILLDRDGLSVYGSAVDVPVDDEYFREGFQIFDSAASMLSSESRLLRPGESKKFLRGMAGDQNDF